MESSRDHPIVSRNEYNETASVISFYYVPYVLYHNVSCIKMLYAL